VHQAFQIHIIERD